MDGRKKYARKLFRKKNLMEAGVLAMTFGRLGVTSSIMEE